MSARPLAHLLLGFSLLVAIPNALAATNLIPGVDVVVRRKPPKGFPTINAETNDKGTIELPRLQAGDYELVIDAKSLLAATTASGHAPVPSGNPNIRIDITLLGSPDDKRASSSNVSAGTAIPFTIPKGHVGVHIEIGQLTQTPVPTTGAKPAPDHLVEYGYNASYLAAGAVNGDGISKKQDITQVPPTAQPPSILIALLMPAVQNARIGGAPVAAGDVNGDGKPDLAGSSSHVTTGSITPSEDVQVTKGVAVTNPTNGITESCKPPSLCLAGVDLVIKNNAGKIIASSQTDSAGDASIHIPETHRTEAPFTLEVEGKSLTSVMDKSFPQPVSTEAPTKKKSGHSSFSIGLGIGGGSSHTTTTPAAAPQAGASPKGEGGGSQTTTSSGGGGVGLGINIPMGGGGKSKKEDVTQKPPTVQPPDMGILVGLLIPAQNKIGGFPGGSTTAVASPAESNVGFTSQVAVLAGSASFTPIPFTRDADGTTLHIPISLEKGSTGPIVVRMAAIHAAESGPVKPAVSGSITKDSWTTKDTKAAPTTPTNNGVISWGDGHAVTSEKPTVATATTIQPHNISWDFGDGSPTGLSNVHALVKNGAGAVILNGLTDANGAITLKDIKPGTYTVEVDGPTFAASFEKTFLGGDARSTSPHYVISAINISLPHYPDDEKVVNTQGHSTGTNRAADTHGSKLFSMETPYCAGTASKGMRFTFTVSPTTGTTSAGPQAYVEEKYQFLAVVLIITGW